MITTPAQLISLALLDAGIIGQGQTASGEDITNGFTRLNMMMAQWNRKRWIVFCLTSTMITSTGAQSYTVGLGGNFNIPRPDKIEDGNYLRILSSAATQLTDYPLVLVQSKEDYSRIVIKQMGTFPQVVYYDPQFPLGQVYFWPVPQATTYGLSIMTKTPLQTFGTLVDVVNLPDEYQAAIYYNLVVRFRAAYRLPPDPIFVALAKDSLNVIRNSNTQIPSLRMPDSVIGRQRGWNVYAGT